MSVDLTKSPVPGRKVFSPYRGDECWANQRVSYAMGMGIFGFGWRTTGNGISYFTGDSMYDPLLAASACFIGAHLQIISAVILCLDGRSDAALGFAIFAYFWHSQWLSAFFRVSDQIIKGEMTVQENANYATVDISNWLIFMCSFVFISRYGWKVNFMGSLGLVSVCIGNLFFCISSQVSVYAPATGKTLTDVASSFITLGGSVAIYAMWSIFINAEFGKVVLPCGYGTMHCVKPRQKDEDTMSSHSHSYSTMV